MEQREFLTTGRAAVAIGGGVQQHHVNRLARRGLIPHQVVGNLRLVRIADLEAVKKVCAECGYYNPAALEVAARG